MYYTSTNREELELYAMFVEKGEQYDGQFTVKWANIIEHKDGNQFAILKHDKYDNDNLQLVGNIDESWFDLPF